MRILPLILAALSLATAARADEAVATAAGAPPAVAPEAPGETQLQIEDFLRHAPAPSLKDATPDGVVPPERKAHGEVGVTVGSGGYRSAYAVSVMPVGKTGTLGLAVSETRFGRNGGPGWGGGFGGGLGGGGTRQTLGLNLALGEAAKDACRPREDDGFRPMRRPDLDPARCANREQDW